jgi:hypothetical protein
MRDENLHPSDEDLLQAADGELPSPRPARGIAFGGMLALPRADANHRGLHLRFRARPPTHRRIANAALGWTSRAVPRPHVCVSAAQPHRWTRAYSWVAAAACLAVLAMALIRTGQWASRPSAVVSVPRSNLTPGAVLLLERKQVCTVEQANNRAVPASRRRRVLQAYGISDADARAYEIDYLVTPALGGADDIRNLWPQSYSATVWNADAKDDLEVWLGALVCAGNLDLGTAQSELSRDWIAAYKKYFHTESPLKASYLTQRGPGAY